MTWRSKNQIIHSFYFFIIFLLIVVLGLAFFLHKKPTCSDMILNQNELGVDCGGICEKVCPSEARNLDIKWTKLSKISEGKYSVSAFVYNPNQNFYLKDANYQFNIKTFDNSSILKTGTLNILPNSSNVIFEIVNSDKELSNLNFMFDEKNEWKRNSNYKQANVTSSNVTFDSGHDLPIVNLIVSNEDIINYKKVLVSIIFYDKDGNVLDVTQTQMKDLLARTSQKAFFSFASLPDYSTYKIITYPVF